MAQFVNGHQSLANGVVRDERMALYVGDIDESVNDSHLFDFFSQIGPVVSVRVCRDYHTHKSLGYAYVNFTNHYHAEKAMKDLNFTPLNNKPIRIMRSHRYAPIWRTASTTTANIFIKNLDKAINNKNLHDIFSVFGNILSCKIATDCSGQSKGYGYVQFDNEGSARNAIERLNGMVMNDKQVYVGHFQPKQDRYNVNNTTFNNVYVKNLTESMTEEYLKKVFGEFGCMTSVVVQRDTEGKSKCFGFVNFENADDAAKAVEALNGKKFEDKEWYVGKAQKKIERVVMLKGQYEQRKKEHQSLNLYLKNLDDSIDDEKLKQLFSEFGTITSSKVMCHSNGISKGSGFVAFSTPEEASRAIAGMHGKMVARKPLYVAIAQRKEERIAILQAQFSQTRPVSPAPFVAPHMPMYVPGSPRLPQQFLYRQAPPPIIPQARFGYQQQVVPRMRPGGGSPRSNFWVPFPMVPQVQRPNGPMQRLQQQARPSRQTLSTKLANASPEQQKNMLGEALYPLVWEQEPNLAGKITGMLLELDHNEVLHLVESAEDLKSKVIEAVNILKNPPQNQQ